MKLPNVDRLTFDEKKHAYKLDGRLMSGVTTIISETSSKGALVQWAANMACDHIKKNATERVPIDGHAGWLYYEVTSDVIEEARTAHAKKRDKAANKGTDTHALVEEYILRVIDRCEGNPKPFPGVGNSTIDPNNPIKPFITWAQDNVDRFLAAEQRLYSETHGYAGTCDFVAIIGGKLTIGDLKTFPKMWSADAFIQMGAYSLAWTELTGTRPEQSVVVKMCDPSDERLRKYGGSAFSVYPRYALAEDEDMFLTRLKMYRYNENFVSPKD